MSEPATAPDDPAGDSTGDPPPGKPSIKQSIQNSARGIWRQCLGVFDLAALETRLAVLNVVEMVALALCAGLFAITAWWLLLAGVTAQLVHKGLSLPQALFIVGTINVILAVLAVLRIRKLGETLHFDATRAALGAVAQINHEAADAAESTPPQG